MFKRNLFEAALKARGVAIAEIAARLKINRATLYKKMAQTTDFTRAEVQAIKEMLCLSTQEAMEIFYAEKVA